MRFWERLSRKHEKPSVAANLELTMAYRNVFKGNPERAQQEMVLADLAAKCGWVQITAPLSGVTSEALWYREGKRAAFAEIFSHLSLSPDDIFALENAARHEAASSNRYELE